MSTGYLLVDVENSHARKAGYRPPFWGHPTHKNGKAGVTKVAIHTSESTFDVAGGDGGAERIGVYLSKNATRAASYHTVVDSDSTEKLLPFSATAFGARGFNTNTIHIAVAGSAADWRELPDAYVQRVLVRLADEVRAACAWADIPLQRITGAVARSDKGTGICAHADLDPDRRSDPGEHFPWATLFALLSPEEDDMPTEPMPDWAKDDFDKAVAAELFSRHTKPTDAVPAWKLAVFLNRDNMLDLHTRVDALEAQAKSAPAASSSTVPQHTHSASVQLS